MVLRNQLSHIKNILNNTQKENVQDLFLCKDTKHTVMNLCTLAVILHISLVQLCI